METFYQVNLELGAPELKSVKKQVAYTIASVRARGGHIIKLWHGSGETESGGRLKEPVRALLRKYKRERMISFFILGEDFSEENEESRYLIEKYPDILDEDEDFGHRNAAYCLVVL